MQIYNENNNLEVFFWVNIAHPFYTQRSGYDHYKQRPNSLLIVWETATDEAHARPGYFSI